MIHVFYEKNRDLFHKIVRWFQYHEEKEDLICGIYKQREIIGCCLLAVGRYWLKS